MDNPAGGDRESPREDLRGSTSSSRPRRLRERRHGGTAMSDPSIDRSVLPIRQPTFKGVANKTLDGSQPDWAAIGHVSAPDGAPNVLLVLIDDAGFGNSGTFGGPIETPTYT